MGKLAHPVMLVIMDGWGCGAADDPSNAVMTAGLQHIPQWLQTYPHAKLITSGEKVGLPPGQMGNSEVGHLNIGAGRVVLQQLNRIDADIRSGNFARKPVLAELLATTAASGKALHLLGLVSDGGVHSHQEHLLALVRAAAAAGIRDVYVHAFLDGRDVPPQSAPKYLHHVEDEMRRIGVGKIVTVSGRYYAMDRDKRWQRTKLAYDVVTGGQGPRRASIDEALERSYADGVTDEFVVPVVIGEPVAMHEGDGAVFFNFRPDRARQLTAALAEPAFDGFAREQIGIRLITMTRYEASFVEPVIYEKESLRHTFGEVVSDAGYTQLRIAETEKYAHVTYFFNGGREEQYPGEDRILVPSPKVATYDLQPEMSAYEMTDCLLAEIEQEKYDFIILNFANSDMVGHSGSLAAAQAAVRTVDTCLGRLWEAFRAKGGQILVTADHGNSEQMWDETNHSPHTAHTTNPVPVFLLSEQHREDRLHDGILADLAPTLLALAGIEAPAEMTGKSLLMTKESK